MSFNLTRSEKEEDIFQYKMINELNVNVKRSTTTKKLYNIMKMTLNVHKYSKINSKRLNKSIINNHYIEVEI